MKPSIRKWRIIDVINWGDKKFSDIGITNSKLEIEWFLCHLLNYRRIDLYLNFDNILSNKYLVKLREMIKRRLAHEPFQHIIGTGSFYGREYIVNRNVLIPRPETELIIEKLKLYGQRKTLLDVGTGTGCLAITSSLEKLANNIVAVDISKNAIQIAKQNAKLLNANNINFILHNFLNNIFNIKFDVIISNPPYLDNNKIKDLDLEVKNFDPHIALTDYSDGLSFYRRFADQFNNLLKDGGKLLLEFAGSYQKKELIKIFHAHRNNLYFHKDLNGEDRVLEIINE